VKEHYKDLKRMQSVKDLNQCFKIQKNCQRIPELFYGDVLRKIGKKKAKKNQFNANSTSSPDDATKKLLTLQLTTEEEGKK